MLTSNQIRLGLLSGENPMAVFCECTSIFLFLYCMFSAYIVPLLFLFLGVNDSPQIYMVKKYKNVLGTEHCTNALYFPP